MGSLNKSISRNTKNKRVAFTLIEMIVAFAFQKWQLKRKPMQVGGSPEYWHG